MKTPISLLGIFSLSLLLTGCFGSARTQQTTVQKRAFLPLVAPAVAQTPRFAALKIRTFRTLPPFDARTFIVRRPGDEFVCDTYNTWIAPPNDLIRAQTAHYLEETHLFSAVYEASSGTLPPLGLEGVISELYLDFTGKKPAAVVTLRLLILNEQVPAFTVLFSAEKSCRVEFDPSDKGAFSNVFGQALTHALEALTHTLMTADLPR